MTLADSEVIDLPMSPSFGNAVWSKFSPGTCTRIGVEGEKPSLRFHCVGSKVTPSTLASSPVGRSTRRPVPVELSSTVYMSLGNGSRQLRLL